MSKQETYTQVKLTQGDKTLVGFIETKSAVAGYTMTVEEFDGRWIVSEVYTDSQITRDEMIDQRQRWATWAKKVDI